MKTWSFLMSGAAPIGAALLSCLFPSMSVVANASDAVVARRSVSGQTYAVLDQNVSAEIIGYARGHSADRIQLHVLLELDRGQTEEAWVHYLPALSERRQSLALFDQDGKQTQDATEAKSLLTLKAGVSAWKTMVHVEGPLPPVERNPASSTLNSAFASEISSQALTPGSDWSADCEEFIDADGNYGKWGVSLLRSVNTQSAALLLGETVGDLGLICPKYADFNDLQRKNFWIWFSAAVAMEESSCNPEVSARGPNGTVAGLWQLDLGHTSDYCENACGSINAYDGEANVACGMKMLNWYTGLDARNEGKLVYWRGNYWQTLHPGNATQRRTDRLVQQYRACH